MCRVGKEASRHGGLSQPDEAGHLASEIVHMYAEINRRIGIESGKRTAVQEIADVPIEGEGNN